MLLWSLLLTLLRQMKSNFQRQESHILICCEQLDLQRISKSCKMLQSRPQTFENMDTDSSIEISVAFLTVVHDA